MKWLVFASNDKLTYTYFSAFSYTCITLQLLQFNPTNAHIYDDITLTTDPYMS